MVVLTFVLTPLGPTHAAVELDTDCSLMDTHAMVYSICRIQKHTVLYNYYGVIYMQTLMNVLKVLPAALRCVTTPLVATYALVIWAIAQ